MLYQNQQNKNETPQKKILVPLATGENKVYETFYDYVGSLEHMNGYTIGSMYNYFFNPSEFVGSTEDYFKKYLLIPPVESVVSLTWTPYVTREDVSLLTVEFDLERFVNNEQLPPDYSTQPEINVSSILFRINKYYTKNKKLGSITCYTPSKNIGGPRSWKNEGKLYNYPFSYGMLFDGVGTPFEFKYHECSTNISDVYVKIANTNLGSYNVYINGYKNDTTGHIEGNTNVRPPQLPVVSNAYMNYMAQSSAQLNANVNASKNNVGSNLVSNIIGGVTSGAAMGAMAGSVIPGAGTAAGAVVGAAGGILSGLVQTGTDYMNTAQNAIAVEADLRKSPNVVNNLGSDTVFNFFNTNGYLTHYKFMLREEYLSRIGDYFAMFGYKQNKIMKPNIRSRYYYNYLKLTQPNLKTNGTIPKEHLESIKYILQSGTTFWHVTNKSVTIGDYSMDNKEN